MDATRQDGREEDKLRPQPAENSTENEPLEDRSGVQVDPTSRDPVEDTGEIAEVPLDHATQEETSSLDENRSFDDAQLASPSETTADQFIVDENVSLGSFSDVELRLRKTLSCTECMCRICHEMDQNDRMISPCKCKGTLSLVHRSCLQHWLAESDSSHCELCGFKYLTKRCPKYSLFGSVLAWLANNRRQRKQMIFDLLVTIAFIPLAGVGTYIGISLAESLQADEEAFGTLSGRIAALSIISLVTTLDVAYATWATIKVQTHLSNWYSWYRRNSEVTLIPP